VDPFEAHLRRAEASFRAGDFRQAGQIWQAILKRDPAHLAAREGLLQVKRALESPDPAEPPPTAVDREELDTLLRQASQLWDLGVPDDAIEKWERVLDLDPQNEEARAFITMVRREQAEAAAAPPRLTPTSPRPEPPPEPQPVAPTLSNNEPTSSLPTLVHEGEDPRLRQGEHLLELRRFDEAIFTFQQVLAQYPDDFRARKGLDQAEEGLRPRPRQAPTADPARVNLPATVTAFPGKRLGLDIPEPLRVLAAHPLVQSPLTWAATIAVVILGSVAISFWRQAAKDRQLKADLNRLIQEALMPAVRASSVVDLEESTAKILAEARSVLSEDPLRAYHRAKEALRRTPEDPAAAQMLEQARAALAPAEPPPQTVPSAHQKAADIDGAMGALRLQLLASPDDPALLRRAASLQGALAQAQAFNGKWDAAKEHLLCARALFPQDRAWNARLYLLDHIPSQPKPEQAGWIALLW
jgi:tetratricopeptide (TPR) repeat protein